MRRLLSITIIAATLCACATVDKTAEPYDDQEFWTGSNIPRRDRPKDAVTVLDKEAFEGLQRWRPNPGQEGPGRGH